LGVDSDAVVADCPVGQLLPLGHKRNVAGGQTAHVVNEGNPVVRQRLEKIDGLVLREDWHRWARETQTVQGIGHFRVEARGGQETGIACATMLEKGAALCAEWAVNKPTHHDGGVDDKGRSRHGAIGPGIRLRAP